MRQTRPVRIEIGLTTSTPTGCGELARAIHEATSVAIAACSSYKKAIEKDVTDWKLAPSVGSSSSKTSFRLVSPWLLSVREQDLAPFAKFLQQVEKMDGLVLNKIVGLRVHLLARGMTCQALMRLCQLCVKYETVLDTFMPDSRRTNSAASQKYFQSNASALNQANAAAAANPQKQQLQAIAACSNTESLIEVVNPGGSCYKLNLRNITTSSNVTATTSFVEFRQHSITSHAAKMQSWLSLCLGLVERATTHTKPPLTFYSSRTLDEQFETLFTSAIPNNLALRTFYEQRRKALEPSNSGATKTTKKSKAKASATSKKSTKRSDQMCGCCFQKIPNKSTICTCQDKGHVFCASCVRQYAKQEVFTNHNGHLTCLAIGGDCTSEFNTRQMEAVLPTATKQRLRELRYVQDTAQQQGKVLCECPKCGAKGIIPQNSRTFSCPLGSCRFHSCRRCKEEAHPSLKCSQVERQTVRNARTSVEEAMSDQLIRRCPNCHTPAVLGSGCNRMTCSSCHTSYCFQCRNQRCTCGNTYSGDITDRQGVRNAGNTALNQVNSGSVRRELNGIVDRLA